MYETNKQTAHFSVISATEEETGSYKRKKQERTWSIFLVWEMKPVGWFEIRQAAKGECKAKRN